MPPAAPSSLVAYPLYDGAVLLTWTDNATGETGYRVLRRTGANPFAVLSGASALPANTTSYRDTLVNVSTTYDYQVVAYDGTGDSGPSNTATVTTSPTPAPPAPPTSDPYYVPSGLDPGAPMYQWIDALGNNRNLSNLGNPGAVAVGLGARGLLMPPVDLTEQATPFSDGARITGTRYPTREVDLPLFVQAASASALRAQLRQIAGWFDPTFGDGTLRITSADGSQRELRCRYAGGLERATDDIQQAGPDWWLLALTLRAADPFFYAVASVGVFFTNAAPVNFFPFFPLTLSPSNLISTAQPRNDGDAEAWPVWTVTGPMTNLVLANNTTGESLTLALTLTAADSVVIDTRPGQKGVTKTISGVSSNALGNLTPASVLWALAKGANDVTITLTGSTGATTVALSFTPRYLAA